MDYEREDLNGDGLTGGATADRFDLDNGGTPRFGMVAQTYNGKTVSYNESALSDLEILCYYAYSPLYAGDVESRSELLDSKCGFRDDTVSANHPTKAICPETIAHNPGYKDFDDLLFDKFTITESSAAGGFIAQCKYVANTAISWGESTARLTLWYSMKFTSNLSGKCLLSTDEPIVTGSTGRIHSTIRALTAWPIYTDYPIGYYNPQLHYQVMEAAVRDAVGMSCDAFKSF